ncbi:MULTISPECIES: hypothetical protein [Streptomyces]|nr:hypothetical protein [Streptomyces acidiscabies]
MPEVPHPRIVELSRALERDVKVVARSAARRRARYAFCRQARRS